MQQPKPMKKSTPVRERKLRICCVFDEDPSVRRAQSLIKNVASDYQCEMQSFRFDELDAPGPGVAAARRACDVDILVLAARGDRLLPSHLRLWLGLCLGLRDEAQPGALVALITKVSGAADLHSSIVEYLETVAIIGGVAFFPQQNSGPVNIASKQIPPVPSQMTGAGMTRPWSETPARVTPT